MLGVLFSYFILFPITFRFLAGYQVDDSIQNLISLESYIDTLTFLSLAMGIVFEIPILSWLLGRLGILHRGQMQQYRRHAIVAILLVAAIITPTSDAITLAVVSLPMYLLYEASILLVPRR
jgi:sec-independent protein translocase protein TatC